MPFTKVVKGGREGRRGRRKRKKKNDFTRWNYARSREVLKSGKGGKKCGFFLPKSGQLL